MKKYAWTLKTKKKPGNIDEILEYVLEKRIGKENLNEFLTPLPPQEFLNKHEDFVSLNKDLTTAKKIIFSAIERKDPIVIHGDYDVDGQSSVAILFKTLYEDLNYKRVVPFIPSRFNEGYGLSKDSLLSIKETLDQKFKKTYKKPLIITVDCGITAVEETKLAKKMGFEVIITDHHRKQVVIPSPDVLVWTDLATGSGIAYLLSCVLLKNPSRHLGLACLGTICDLQPLIGFNRSVVKYGLESLNKDMPLGLSILKSIALIKGEIDTYEVGWQIGPRLNAAGRLESALDSLRLLCTASKKQAQKLSMDLNRLNKERQDKTIEDVKYARDIVLQKEVIPRVLIVKNENYHEGIIGLVASRISKELNRPSLVIAIEKEKNVAKGSARSIRGISVIDMLNKLSHLFINVGGHDMAAGFSLRLDNVEKLEKELLKYSQRLEEGLFNKFLEIDLELDSFLASLDAYFRVMELKPFGVGNLDPTFVTKNLKLVNILNFGKENNHIKLTFIDQASKLLTGVYFNGDSLSNHLVLEEFYNVCYNLSLNTWGNTKKLELKIVDMERTL